MKKLNILTLTALVAIACLFNVSCTSYETEENATEVEKPMHHLGFYSFSNDLLEIYDAQVEAVCDGQVLSTIDIKKSKAYSSNAETTSYNVDMFTTAKAVEYKLKLTCCKNDADLDLSRTYELGLNAQFISVSSAPDAALEMLDSETSYFPQALNGMTLQSFYGIGQEYSGQSVYEVYAIVNSKSFVLGSY